MELATAAAPEPTPVQRTASKKWAFTALFMVEMWERFGYYGMAGLLVLFLKDKNVFGYSDDRANLTFGAFSAMVYAAPAIGGFIGDKLLGSRRMTVIGAAVLCLGYAMIAIPSKSLVFVALALIAVGNGLFKANPANLVSKIYEGEPSKIDSAFTMYYMAVNVGATASQLLTPLIAVWFGWYVAFAVCSAGLAVGVINYFIMRPNLAHVGSKPDFEPLNYKRLALVLGGAAVVVALATPVMQNMEIARVVVYAATLVLIGLFGWLIAKGSPADRKGLIAVLILTMQGILFFVFYQQMSTSLTLFALRNVNLHFGYDIPAAQVQVLNPIWIFLLSPIVAWYYNYRTSSGKGDFSVAAKFAIGFVVLAFSFFLYAASGWMAHEGKAPFWLIILAYGLQSLSELLISGLGLAMVARYVGPSLRGFIMGVYFLSTGLSQYLGSVVANFASVPEDVTDPLKTMALYTNLFWWLGAVAVGGAVVAFALLPLMKKLSTPTEAQPAAAA